MSKQDTVSNYPENYDWESATDFDDRNSEKDKVSNRRMSRKRNIKRRLDDYIDTKRLQSKQRYLDSFEDDYDFQ